MTTAPAPVAASPRYVSLDGLRGAAALIVVVHHSLLGLPDIANPLYNLGGAGPLAWYVNSPLHIFTAGEEAVVVFFILSGFVLTLPVLRGNYRWLPYYGSRLTRLYLPVIASVVWALIVVALVPRRGLISDVSPWLRGHDETLSPLKVLGDIVLLTPNRPSSLNGPLWSLRWEIFFSILLPLFVFLAVKLRRWWLAVVMGIALFQTLVVLFGKPTLQYLPTFLVGTLFAANVDSLKGAGHRIRKSPRRSLWWLLLAGIAVLLTTARWPLQLAAPSYASGIGVGAVLIGASLWFFIALECPLARRFLEWRPVHWLGVISFSLYLVHEPIAIAVNQLLPVPARGWAVLLVPPVSLLAAWGFSIAIERPSHRASQWVRRSLTGLEQRRRSVSSMPTGSPD